MFTMFEYEKMKEKKFGKFVSRIFSDQRIDREGGGQKKREGKGCEF